MNTTLNVGRFDRGLRLCCIRYLDTSLFNHTIPRAVLCSRMLQYHTQPSGGGLVCDSEL
jgi:hypothetical protein